MRAQNGCLEKLQDSSRNLAEAISNKETISNRLAQMDGEVPLILPSEVARERAAREVTGNIPTQASLLQKQNVSQKHHALQEESAASSHSKLDTAKETPHKFAQRGRNKSSTSYHEFLPYRSRNARRFVIYSGEAASWLGKSILNARPLA